MPTISAIPIKAPWIKMILNGSKEWEIRSKFTKKLGPVALIQSGTGTVVAMAKIAEVIKLTEKTLIIMSDNSIVNSIGGVITFNDLSYLKSSHRFKRRLDLYPDEKPENITIRDNHN